MPIDTRTLGLFVGYVPGPAIFGVGDVHDGKLRLCAGVYVRIPTAQDDEFCVILIENNRVA